MFARPYVVVSITHSYCTSQDTYYILPLSVLISPSPLHHSLPLLFFLTMYYVVSLNILQISLVKSKYHKDVLELSCQHV